MSKSNISRRVLVKSSLFGVLGISLANVTYAKSISTANNGNDVNNARRYPAIDDEVVAEVVGKSHFDLDRVKELVTNRPELARATWDWGFGDWESAIGAASHVGRRDIVALLIEHGARPTLFTMAMLGAYDVVKSTILFQPGIQKNLGPHGISLLSHAKAGMRMQDEMSLKQVEQQENLIAYLEELGDADGESYDTIIEKEKYLGDYKFGDGEEDGFSIRLNMRKLLALGKIGTFGGAIYKIGANQFIYNGAPSTVISFQFAGDTVVGLTVTEPNLSIKAEKIN